MRIPRYLSPSSLKGFYEDRDKFYMERLSETKLPRDPQTRPMSVGSAFDARVKSELYGRYYDDKNPQFDFQTLFEAQVEPQNRDWALKAGEDCYQAYKRSGAMADLVLELEAACGRPKFETSVEGQIDGVPVLGKPDIYFITADGLPVIIDWKVNGYCGSGNTSPRPGYVMLRDGWEGKASRTNGSAHKDAVVMRQHGIMCNVAQSLHEVEEDWAAQTAIYAWLLGAKISGPLLVGIDQLACNVLAPDMVRIRIAKFRCSVAMDFQNQLRAKLARAWKAITSGHIFDEMSREQSDLRCQQLESGIQIAADEKTGFLFR